SEEWLHAQAQQEGWSRATKLESRVASQGLVGILMRRNVAAMVEVNCETDFVARNELFKQLVKDVASSCLDNFASRVGSAGQANKAKERDTSVGCRFIYKKCARIFMTRMKLPWLYRCLSTVAPNVASVEKSSLSILRKKTGYSFLNCKKALALHDNDIAKSEEWLHAQAQQEGWSRATKLESRVASQGLVGILMRRNVAAMVEVNCETDFVARNELFKQLVKDVASSCLDNFASRILISGEELKELKLHGGRLLADDLALGVGKLGENLVARRGCAFGVAHETGSISAYAHPSNTAGVPSGDHAVFFVGRVGGLVAFDGFCRNPDVGLQLCRHIVGMKPSSIGQIDEFLAKQAAGSDQDNIPAAAAVEDEETQKKDESRLIFQEFLEDENVLVGDVLLENGILVSDFVRFECGES
ncbi:unnamed protein product, partial [Notodromas monacha]